MDVDTKLLYQFATSAFERLKIIDSTEVKNLIEKERNTLIREIYINFLEKAPPVILKYNREFPHLYFFYGNILYYLNKNTPNKELKENAIRLIKNSIENSVDNQKIEYIKSLIEILLNEKKYTECIGYCNYIIKFFPDNIYYYNLIIDILIKTNKKEEAIDYYKKLISLNPYDYENYTNLGKLYLSLKNYDDALKLFQKSKDIDQKFPDNYKYIGKILLINNKKALAISNFKTAIARKLYNFEQYEKNLKIQGKTMIKLDSRDDEKNTYLFLFECYLDLIKCGENYYKELYEIENKILLKNYLDNEKINLIKKRYGL